MLPTPEQANAVDLFTRQLPTKVIAFAGAGKTSTLVTMAKCRSWERGMYIAFNKVIANEASQKFAGTKVTAKTAHSIAFGVVASMGFDPSTKMTPAWKSRDFLMQHPGDVTIHPSKFRTLVGETLKNFCQSWDDEIGQNHVPQLSGLDETTQTAVNAHAPVVAAQIWQEMITPAHRQPLGHDGYLKLWSLNRPRILGGFLMVDEAQDLNGVLIGAVRQQQAQIICVGDSHQQIYSWRGAKDALRILPGTEARLTQSFRFGEAIALVANRILLAMDETHPLRGNPNVSDAVYHDRAARPDAILCRSNGGVIGEAIEWQSSGTPVHIPGGVAELMRLLTDAEALQAGRPVLSVDLMGFTTWQDVRDHSETAEGTGLRAFVRLVDRFGVRYLQGVLAKILDREVPGCITISTAHKAKGREWPCVQIAEDFHAGDNPSLEERRLFYVAITRAQHALHVSAETLKGFSA